MRFRDRDAEERIVYVEREHEGGGFRWFVIGAALGAGLGLLFAPRSGARTRKELGRRLTNLKEQAEEQLDSLAGGIEAGADRLQKQVDRWGGEEEAEEDDEEDGETEEPGEEEEDADVPELTAREELELRLQQARARRRGTELDVEEEPVT